MESLKSASAHRSARVAQEVLGSGYSCLTGGTAMSDTTIGLDQIEEEMLAYEVSDTALETAAGTARAGNYTLFFCTALDMCPGP